ncbi:MAG: diacylglyceryl transferase [Chloroflexi bacterium]|nr:diacylglyceryl transferase [Chloroflexota bacterium]
MFPIINIGPLALQSAILILVLGLFAASEVFSRRAVRLGLPENIQNAGGLALVVGVLAARLGYAALHLDAYLRDPVGLVSPQMATTSVPAGLVAGGIFFAWRIYRRELPPRLVLDALAPGLALMLAALAIRDLALGENVGLPADLPWAIDLWNARRHPVQLYLAIPALLLAVWSFRRGTRPFPGFDFLVVLGGYTLAVLITSMWRESSTTLPGDLRQEQLIAWLVLLGTTGLGARWSQVRSALPSTEQPISPTPSMDEV